MKRFCSILLALLCMAALSACGDTMVTVFGVGGRGEHPASAEASAGGTAAPVLEETGWAVVSVDAETFQLSANENFEATFQNISSIPLDELVAFSLVADGGYAEGASYELRERFLEAPNTVLTYLALLGDQRVEWEDQLLASEAICRFIAYEDACGCGGSEKFAQTVESCRAAYPEGRVAHLLDAMEAAHAAALEQQSTAAAPQAG